MSALVFIFVLGGLVIIHEWGHFIVARLCGVRVEKFSVGFGPVIFSRKSRETEYCVSLLPLGGFVKLDGESAEEATGQAWEFNSKSLGAKAAIVLAGPLMNAFLAFVIFAFIFMAGQPTLTTEVGKILDKTPAAEAGMLPGDTIRTMNGAPVTHWEEVLKAIRASEGPLTLGIERAGRTENVIVTPRREETRDIFGRRHRAAFLGIAPATRVVYVKRGVPQAVVLAGERVWTLTAMVFQSLYFMISGAMSFKDSVTGPIGIYFMTQQAAEMGAAYLFYFMGSLSVSLFVLNILPIPVLDGGHLLFILIEKIKGSPLKAVWKERLTQGGLVALLGLMGFVIIQDVHKFSIIENILKMFRGGA